MRSSRATSRSATCCCWTRSSLPVRRRAAAPLSPRERERPERSPPREARSADGDDGSARSVWLFEFGRTRAGLVAHLPSAPYCIRACLESPLQSPTTIRTRTSPGLVGGGASWVATACRFVPPPDYYSRGVLFYSPPRADSPPAGGAGTGSSATEAIKILLERGVAAKRIILCTLIASPPGIQNICTAFPEVRGAARRGAMGAPPGWVSSCPTDRVCMYSASSVGDPSCSYRWRAARASVSELQVPCTKVVPCDSMRVAR